MKQRKTRGSAEPMRPSTDQADAAIVVAVLMAVQRARNQQNSAGRARRAEHDGHGSGPIPYGYREGWHGIIAIEPNEADVIRLAITMARECATHTAIATELNFRGTLTRDQLQWTALHVRTLLRHGIEAATRWPIILEAPPGTPILPQPRRGRKPRTPHPAYVQEGGVPLQDQPKPRTVLPRTITVPPLPLMVVPVSNPDPPTQHTLFAGQDDWYL